MDVLTRLSDLMNFRSHVSCLPGSVVGFDEFLEVIIGRYLDP